jgi:hypothetical protein
MQSENKLARMVELISEKRCDGYAHSQEDEFNEALKEFLQ